MFNFSKKNKTPENMKDVLVYIEELKKENEKILKKIEEIKKEIPLFINKVEVSRYNPFSGTGGNQSFTIVILDGNNSGAIVSSLFTEGGNRVYSKKITNGNSEYPLSEEEKKVLLKVLNK